MKKELWRFIGFFLLVMTSCIEPAWADKEVVQKVLKKADRFEKNAIVYLEGAQKIKRSVQGAYQGVQGTIKKAKAFTNAVMTGDIAGAISSGMSVASDLGAGDGVMNEFNALQSNYDTISNAYGQANNLVGQASGLLSQANGLLNSPLDQMVGNVPSFISNINDLGDTISDVEKNIIPKVSRTENSVAFQEHEEKVNDVLRETLASLYAQAFVTRSEIADEKAKTPEEIDTTNERALIGAATDSVTRSVVRLVNIYQMEAAMLEFKALYASGYSGQRTEEE